MESESLRHNTTSKGKVPVKNGNRYSIDMILGKLLTESSKKETVDESSDTVDDSATVISEVNEDDVKAITEDTAEKIKRESNRLEVSEKSFSDQSGILLILKHCVIYIFFTFNMFALLFLILSVDSIWLSCLYTIHVCIIIMIIFTKKLNASCYRMQLILNNAQMK